MGPPRWVGSLQRAPPAGRHPVPGAFRALAASGGDLRTKPRRGHRANASGSATWYAPTSGCETAALTEGLRRRHLHQRMLRHRR